MNLIDDSRGKKSKSGQGGNGAAAGEISDTIPTNKFLDTSFLIAFLWCREAALSPHYGQEVFGTEKRANGGYGSMDGIPSHIIVEKNGNNTFNFFVPLDRVVHIVKLVLNFLTPRKLATYSRQIEKRCMLLDKEGRVSKGEGARMIIRNTMRIAMLKKSVEDSGGGGDGGGDDDELAVDDAVNPADGAEGAKDEVQVVVNLYDTLEMIMEILAIRTHNMEDQLKRFFIEGDDNGDGVLSFEEFDALLKRVAPTFSDRRILRMFREALTAGDEDGFSIDKGDFANVCRNHGLVKLIETRSLSGKFEEDQEMARKIKDAREREGGA